jgi:hypothetical protein
MEKRAGMDFAMFVYGVKVKLTCENKTRSTVMMLNPLNNFFLEFVESKDGLRIKKTIFIPYIKNVRAKIEENRLKIRMRNEKNNIYLRVTNPQKLARLEDRFSALIVAMRPFPYAIYSTNNLLYYALYELKIYKAKDKPFTSQDVHHIIEIIKIRKKRFQTTASFNLNSTITVLDGTMKLSKTASLRTVLDSNVEYCRYIKRKIEQLLETGKPLNLKVMRDLFTIMVEKEELFAVFEKYSLPKEERSLLNDTSISWKDVSPVPVATNKHRRMPFENLMAFIQEVQQEKIDGDLIETLNSFFHNLRAESIFDKIPDAEIKDISFSEFSCYMFSELNNVFDPDKQVVYQDLEYRMVDYWVNTSHNTYLTGHQLYGKTTLEGIERAIEQGCRCIELDCWDGSNGEPMVTHGLTLTSGYPFAKMVEKLGKIAFQNPLILSLEMHCNRDQREKVAAELKRSFAKRLLVLNKDTVRKTFKLSQLMKTVIVKSDSNYPDQLEVFTARPKTPKDFDNDTLSQITVLFKEKRNQEELSTPFGMISAQESKIFEQLSRPEDKKRLRATAQNNFIRIYPDGTRVSSSNYNPIECWFNGIQMAAINIQFPDEFSLINKILFLENGGPQGGFLLKPPYIRADTPLKINQYTVEVISGQIIGNNLLDEKDFLEIYVVSPSMEHKNDKYTLRFSSNFIHPAILQDISPIRFVIIYPELSFLMFRIRSPTETLKLLGAIPFGCIRPGLRVLDLYDKDLYLNKFSYLLLQINKG